MTKQTGRNLYLHVTLARENPDDLGSPLCAQFEIVGEVKHGSYVAFLKATGEKQMFVNNDRVDEFPRSPVAARVSAALTQHESGLLELARGYRFGLGGERYQSQEWRADLARIKEDISKL